MVDDEYGDDVVLPFFLHGVTSSLHVEPLTRREWDAHSCPRVTLTDLDLTWDPMLTSMRIRRMQWLTHTVTLLCKKPEDH